MDERVWMSVVVVVVVLAGAVWAVRWHRRAGAGGPDATLRAARRAIRQSRQDQRRRRHTTIRGKGHGGDDSQGYNAGVSSESGGMP